MLAHTSIKNNVADLEEIDIRESIRFQQALHMGYRCLTPILASAWKSRLVLRLSAQAYVGIEDYAQLADVLKQQGWPGR